MTNVGARNQNPQIENIYRGYNFAVAALVAYDWFHNPKAEAVEYFLDIGIHLFEALAPNTWNNVALVANVGRGLQAAHSFFTGKSSIPEPANAADVFNHGVNTAHRMGYF